MNDFEMQRRLRALNTARAPQPDLWPAIAQRIAAAPAAPVAQRRRRWLPLAAAAALLCALGGALYLGGQGPHAPAERGLASAPGTPAYPRAAGTQHAAESGTDPRLVGASAVLDSAHDELEQALQERPRRRVPGRSARAYQRAASETRTLRRSARRLNPMELSMKRFPSLPLLTLLLVCGSALGAGTPIEQHRAVSADARIDISNVKGAVNVTAWDKADVAIGGTLGEGAKGLAIEGGGDHLSIKVQAPDHQGWFSWGADARMGDTVLDLKVPRSAALKIEVVSADVNVTGVAGRSLDVHSVSGKLRLDSGADEVEIDTVSGNIDLGGRATQGHLQTVSGNIRTRGLGGRLKFESVSGDISADNAAYHELDLSTVSGDIVVRGRPDPAARIDIESMSGDVHLNLPADVSTRLRASSFSGTLRSDFGTIERPEHGPGSSLDATTGSGAGRIKIEAFSGDVEIRKQ